MEVGFQKSWSIHGYRKIDNHNHNDHFKRQGMMFQSTRTNLQQHFPYVNHEQNQCLNQSHFVDQLDENGCPFYLRQQPGLRFRSLTDSNIRQFDVNGATRSCNEHESPKTSFRQPFQQLPQRIGPLLSNIQRSVSQARPKTEKFFQKGGEKVQKAMKGVHTSFTSFSQRFKRTTRRRYHLENTPTTTPTRTPSRGGKVTPGKLYSPFDLNTPRTPRSYIRPKRLQNGASRRNLLGSENPTLTRTPPNFSRPGCTTHPPTWATFSSPFPSSNAHAFPEPVFGSLGRPVGPPQPHYVNVPIPPRRI